ncbi:hypothetical protein M8J76_000644 [Diaphorina citri]|nr:hypothetical protein M8J76_000644 [Diaphorina citri]
MARGYTSFLLLAVVCAISVSNAKNLTERTLSFGSASQPTRQARFFGNLLNILTGYDYDYGSDGSCPPNGCPPWRCQQDSAVIHGYCCGCARPTGLFNLFGNRVTRGPHKKFYCPSRGCPAWSCQDDSSIIHGYCCGCAHPDDNVPFVTCRPDLRCPLSSEPLCTDYNFMMDCCCTGP